MSRTYVALDIRDQAITSLLIKGGLKAMEILGHIQVPIEHSEETENPWYDALASIKDHFEVRGAVCLVTFPSALASFRNLKLPFKDKKKIRQVLPFEVEPLLPFPLSEVILDYQMVRAGEASDLIAVAVQKSRMQPILDALSELRMTPERILPAGFPVALCLARQRPEETALYIDSDATTSTIFAICAGSIYLVRSVYMGGASRDLKTRTLKTHIQRLLVAFETIYEFDFQPERALLSGEGAFFEPARDALQSLMDIPVKPVDMMDQSGFLVQTAAELDETAIADNPLALAAMELQNIASVNFYEQSHLLYRYWEAHKADIIKTGGIAAFVLIVAMGGLIFETQHLKQKNKQMDKQVVSIFKSTFPEVSRIVDPVQQMKVNVERSKEKDRFAGLRDDGVLNIEILNALSRVIPPDIDVVITRFVRGEGQAVLSGHTATFNAVDDIKGGLTESPYFKEITISSANMEQSANRVQFKLKMTFADADERSGQG